MACALSHTSLPPCEAECLLYPDRDRIRYSRLLAHSASNSIARLEASHGNRDVFG
jgi:hypothetical protein